MSKRDELRSLAERLLVLSAEEPKHSDVSSEEREYNADLIEYDDQFLAQIAKNIYKIRRNRASYISSELLAEPAWDMLLDLFIQKTSGRRVTVTSLCIASAVPLTTGLRWVTALIECDLIYRIDSEKDRRKAYLALTDNGYRAVRSTLIDANRYLMPRNFSFMLSKQMIERSVC